MIVLEEMVSEIELLIEILMNMNESVSVNGFVDGLVVVVEISMLEGHDVEVERRNRMVSDDVELLLLLLLLLLWYVLVVYVIQSVIAISTPSLNRNMIVHVFLYLFWEEVIVIH